MFIQPSRLTSSFCEDWHAVSYFVEGVMGIIYCHCIAWLKVVSATFMLVCFVCLQESTCEIGKNVFYFASKALFVLETIKF